MPALVIACASHACCAVRGTLVVLGGSTSGGGSSSSVEILEEEGGAFVDLPPLSCGGIYGAAAIAVEESDSAAGQVLLIGGLDEDVETMSTVQLVDLATGACAPQNNLLHSRVYSVAGRLANGRVVCAEGFDDDGSSVEAVEVLEPPPEQGVSNAAWIWSKLPAMSAHRYGCCGCVMSDGCFAVLGGVSNSVYTSSCEALAIDEGVAHWEPLPPMHDTRSHFACGDVAGCVIAAGGHGRKSAEVYDESRGRWLRLPNDLPYENGLALMGSALL
jgi:hypothetical protein